MKAVIINSYGSPELLKLSSVADPELRNGEILVKNHASSVNPIDCKIRGGKLKFFTGKKFPKILGADFSGKVLKSNSPKYKIGDEVFGAVNPLKGGGYSEKIVVNEENLALKPKNLDHSKAVVLPMVGVTSLQALTKKTKIKAGDQVLINGCSGGVGSTAVQLAKYYKANVTGVCSTKNIELCKSLGVDKVIDYTKESISGIEQYDIIFDTIGNLKFSNIKTALKPKGVFLTTAFSLNIALLSLIYRIKMVIFKPNESDLKLLSEMSSKGFIKPIIDKTYNWSALSEAHKYSETGRVRGKISLTIKE